MFCCSPSFEYDTQVPKQQQQQHQQHAPSNLPHPQLRHHQSFNQSSSSSCCQGQPRHQPPRRTQSQIQPHAPKIPPNHLPYIPESLDPGWKQEISQQVREFRAQKLSQRGCSPGPSTKQSRSAGQVPKKGPSQNPSSPAPNPNPLRANNQRDKSGDRPLSAPVEGAVLGPKSPDLQLKSLQPQGNIQKSQSGSNNLLNPAVKMVSDNHR